jgi:hypothetical protein
MTAEIWLNANLVRLQKAVLCANCDIISEGLNGYCAACGSQSLLRLSGLLGGTIQSEPALSRAVSGPVACPALRARSVSAAA